MIRDSLVASTLDSIAATGLHEVPERDDPLAEALHFLRMDGMFYCLSELRSPWGLELPAMPDCLWFHVVTDGSCVLIDSTGQERHLTTGDVVLLPHGAGHSAVDAIGSPTPLVFDLPHHYVSRSYAVLEHGGSGPLATIICGVAQLGTPVGRTLSSLLPEVIHIDQTARRSDWHWLPAILSLMAAETQSPKPGGETVVTRLCDVLVVQAIRTWIDTAPEARSGWLGALRDPQVGRAISLIHRDPAAAWTVTSLAASVGMSRSGFSARFNELVGVAPKRYVTQWRMQLAEDLLQSQSLSILAIAHRLGYQSEAAFSRAFKRETGSAPSRVRRRHDVVALAQDLSDGQIDRL